MTTPPDDDVVIINPPTPYPTDDHLAELEGMANAGMVVTLEPDYTRALVYEVRRLRAELRPPPPWPKADVCGVCGRLPIAHERTVEPFARVVRDEWRHADGKVCVVDPVIVHP